jgi:hypothetical protein
MSVGKLSHPLMDSRLATDRVKWSASGGDQSGKARNMAETVEELQSFFRFADQRLRNGACDQSLDDLFAEWRVCNPTPEELERNVVAVQAALRDMEAGETGRPFEEFAEEFRQRNGI